MDLKPIPGTPASLLRQSESTPSIITLCLRQEFKVIYKPVASVIPLFFCSRPCNFLDELARKRLLRRLINQPFNKFPSTSMLLDLVIRPRCQTLSKALDISRRTARPHLTPFIKGLINFVNNIYTSCITVESPGRKPLCSL